MKSIDLSGLLFTNLQVIKKLEYKSTDGRTLYLCVCTCGKLKTVKGKELSNGHVKSCGCLRTFKLIERRRALTPTYIGKKYFKLKVISGPIYTLDEKCKCKVKCDCGTIKNVTQSDLINKKIKSCGCILSDSQRKKTKNLIGKSFSYLTVISNPYYILGKYSSYSNYKCKCKCGNIIEVRAAQLLSLKTKSCGCLQKSILSKSRRKLTQNLINKKFGKLKVISEPLYDKRRAYCKCICECGILKNIYQCELTSKKTRSCGCMSRNLFLELTKTPQHRFMIAMGIKYKSNIS